MITTAELTDLLKSDLAKLTPVGADMTRRAIDQIEVRGIQASPQSLNTRALMSALASVPELLAPGVEERIARHEIFGVESDYIGAVVRPGPSGAGQIFVFEGFLAFLHHFASSITVLNAFLSHDPGRPHLLKEHFRMSVDVPPYGGEFGKVFPEDLVCHRFCGTFFSM